MPADLKSKIAGIIRNCVMATVRTEIDGSLQGIEEAASRIAALVPAAEWQPIETAPRDKVVLLGYKNKLGNWRTLRGRWVHNSEIEELSDDSDDLIEGWYEDPVEGEVIYPTPATHWQPLPTPPGTPARRGYTGEDERLPCDVQVGSVRFRKGVKTKLVFDAIARRASEEE